MIRKNMYFFPTPLDVFSNYHYLYELLSELFKLIIRIWPDLGQTTKSRLWNSNTLLE